MNNNMADTIVIGAGIAGSSTAFRLAQKGQKVILLDKGRVGEEASGRNAGGVRQQMRAPAELPLAMESIKIWSNMRDELDCDVGYRRGGNLCVARSEEEFRSYHETMKQEQAMGLGVEILSPEETRRLTPTIPGELEIFGGKHCPSDGWANPLLVVKAICRAARRKGVQIKEHEPVRRLKAENGRVTGAVTDKGEYYASTFVVAAGAWSSGLCRTIGLDLPVTVDKAQTFVTEALPPIVKQFVSMKEILYVQSTEGNILIGVMNLLPYIIKETENINNNAILGEFAELGRWLQKILPFLRNVNLIRTFGAVDQCTPDEVAILDKASGLENLYASVGAGHGYCMGPVVGKMIAEWIVDGRSSMDLTGLRWNRFEGKPGLEEFKAQSGSVIE